MKTEMTRPVIKATDGTKVLGIFNNIEDLGYQYDDWNSYHSIPKVCVNNWKSHTAPHEVFISYYAKSLESSSWTAFVTCRA
ncbi:hypothetical protein SC09_Contig25orf00527 [Bacillus subtilis]|uniref:Uncharacterized protein n=1 Tax=Bacillus subtilis TaxID=1423 RepID=A0A0D1IN89_BACIU|nr:hypothetical protein SC09_Contig25orf00527 [Bacillus subtilis]